jgi:hypothetical protein
MSSKTDLMVGPDPLTRISKRRWEASVQGWRRELAKASPLFQPIGLIVFDGMHSPFGLIVGDGMPS